MSNDHKSTVCLKVDMFPVQILSISFIFFHLHIPSRFTIKAMCHHEIKKMILSLNNSTFCYCCMPHRFPIKLKMKDTTETFNSVIYLDLHIDIDNIDRLRTKLCNKRNKIRFPIVSFPFPWEKKICIWSIILQVETMFD